MEAVRALAPHQGTVVARHLACGRGGRGREGCQAAVPAPCSPGGGGDLCSEPVTRWVSGKPESGSVNTTPRCVPQVRSAVAAPGLALPSPAGLSSGERSGPARSPSTDTPQFRHLTCRQGHSKNASGLPAHQEEGSWARGPGFLSQAAVTQCRTGAGGELGPCGVSCVVAESGRRATSHLLFISGLKGRHLGQEPAAGRARTRHLHPDGGHAARTQDKSGSLRFLRLKKIPSNSWCQQSRTTSRRPGSGSPEALRAVALCLRPPGVAVPPPHGPGGPLCVSNASRVHVSRVHTHRRPDTQAGARSTPPRGGSQPTAKSGL